MLSDIGMLVLRMVTGPLLTGHGAQKLFGAFGGSGVEGTKGFMRSLGLRPSGIWARLAGASEFASGILTSLGLFHPVGPIMMMAPMAMAVSKVHLDKPIWVTEGGGELPVTNMAVAAALALSGPGRISLDRILGIHVPWPVVALALIGTAGGVFAGMTTQRPVSQEAAEVAGSKLQGGPDASVVGKAA